MRPLSYSSISTYMECPLKFKLKYIDGLKEKPKPYLSFGSSLHEALRFMYSYRPPPPSLEAVLDYYEKNWIDEGYANEEEEEGYFSYGKQILSAFYNANIKDFSPPISVEYKFDIEIDGIPVMGFIDRIDKIEGNNAEIIDYKSGKNIFDKTHVEENEQLTLYQLALEESIGLKVGRLTLYHLPSQTPVSSDARSVEKIDELRSKIMSVADRISKGEFEAKEGRFCPCDFPEHCPYYRHLHIKDVEEAIAAKTTIQQTIEEYSELKDQERELALRAKFLAERIHAYCDDKDLNRIFSEKHAVTRTKVEKKGYDEAKLRELLEPKGLWDRVLSYNDALTKELLDDPQIDGELRADILKLQEIKKAYYQLRVRDLKKKEVNGDVT